MAHWQKSLPNHCIIYELSKKGAFKNKFFYFLIHLKCPLSLTLCIFMYIETPTLRTIYYFYMFYAGPSLGLISGRHSAPFPMPNSIFFSQNDSSKFPTEHSQICWPKLVQSNDIYSSNSVLSFINVQMALVNAVFKGYYHWSVLWMRVVYLHKTALPLKRHSNVDYFEIESRTAGSQKIGGNRRPDSAALLSGFYSKQTHNGLQNVV